MTTLRLRLFQALPLFLFPLSASAQETLPLDGQWRITLDGNYRDWPVKIGISEKWYARRLPSNDSVALLNRLYFRNLPFRVKDEIHLPGTTDEAGIGSLLQDSPVLTSGLERRLRYDGAFWVQREVTVPESWRGRRLTLFLERLQGASQAFWDGVPVSSEYGYGHPHSLFITGNAVPGVHRLTVLVNPDDSRYSQYGHHVVTSIGMLWNGIIGKIELQSQPADFCIQSVQVYPDIRKNQITFRAGFAGKPGGSETVVTASLRKKGEEAWLLSRSFPVTSDSLSGTLSVPEPVRYWSEFSPGLYELRTVIRRNGTETEERILTFGMREIGTNGRQITLNGIPVFLRGTVDCNMFPLTGYTFMDKASWLKQFRIYREYGLNHVRFHTWCPPEAAFEAADETGLILQPELCGIPYAELNRILDTYGNHPSFGMLSLNNEAFTHNVETRRLTGQARQRDPRHLVACTSNPLSLTCTDDFYISAWGNDPSPDWPFFNPIVGITWGGGDVISASRFNRTLPATTHDYRAGLKDVKAPLISHEIGQWASFPRMEDNAKFNGTLRNTNGERIEKMLKENGLFPLAGSFSLASGKLAALLYKEEIESAFRTPGFGGFQLLGLADYQNQWISIVGILNDFGESKGLVSPEIHREYCGPVVPLARLPKRVWTAGETFSFGAEIANYSDQTLKEIQPEWTFTTRTGKQIGTGKLPVTTVPAGGLTSFGSVQISTGSVTEAVQAELVISVPGTLIRNSWSCWIYPKAEPVSAKPKVAVFKGTELNQALEALQNGETVLLLADRRSLVNFRDSCFTPVFWNSTFKWPQKAHTLGILVDPDHPAFRTFPTAFHSDWQWWDLVMNGWPMSLSALPPSVQPVIRAIDTYTLNTPLGYLIEAKAGNGKLMICSFDLTRDLENRPAARQLKSSLMRYLSGPEFTPSATLSRDDLKKLIRE